MLSKELKHKIRRAWARKAWEDGPTDTLALKQEIRDLMDVLAVDGKVGLVVWQMDCDCASWTSLMVIENSLVDYNRAITGVYSNAEGPVRIHLASPDTEVQRGERDHALEAYEDGHPYSVSY